MHEIFMMKTVSQDYNRLASLFHWGMALLIFGLLIVGFVMTDLPASPMKFQVYGLHKSMGLLVLGFGFMRLIWRFMSAYPLSLSTHVRWERFLSKTIHIVFYVSIFVMPLSGWVMSSAGAHPVRFFGLFEMPALGSKNEVVFEAMEAVHLTFAVVLVGALGLHVAGALKHHLIDRDETVRRMGGNRTFAIIGVLLLMASSLLAGDEILDLVSAESENGHNAVNDSRDSFHELRVEVVKNNQDGESVSEWVIDPMESVIALSFLQYGQSVDAAFMNWEAQIVFDPQGLDHSFVRAEIDMTSLETGSMERDVQVRGEEWFDVQTYPRAIFESESFESLGANRYRADGVLSLRGVKNQLSFPFSLTITPLDGGAKQATMAGDFTLNRLDLGIGQGTWKSTEAIGNSVNVRVNIVARASGI